MPNFEERFAAFGRSIDALIDRARSGRQTKAYRSRPRRTVGERFREWRLGAGEKASEAAGAVADWRRGLDGGGARRLNILMILGAVVLTAAVTWMWTRAYSTGLTSREVQALSKMGRESAKPQPPAPAAGPWWNQATTK